MDLVGVDNILETTEDPRAGILRFVHSVGARWPRLIGDVSVAPNLVTWVKFGAQDIPSSIPEKGAVYLLRDVKMQRHSEKKGWVPMRDGEGPLSVFYGKRAAGWSATLVTPGDPAVDRFSLWAWDEIRRCVLSDARQVLGPVEE